MLETIKDMNEIRISDEIVCTDDSEIKNELTVGKTYKVLDTDYSDFELDGTFLICVENDEGDILDYGGVRFGSPLKR